MTFKRRDFLTASAAVAGMAGLSPFGIRPSFAQAAEPVYKPEEGASLRLLRWTPFVKGDEDAWLANTSEIHGSDWGCGPHRQGELGGHSPKGRGRRQCRVRAGSGDVLV